MDISFYLIELLRLHDCVIIPDLGGFVTNYRPAEMDLANNSFKPPVKDVIFTGKLVKNDGLLVNYISETEGIGYIDARHIISEFVEETWSKLDNGDKVIFQHIGILSFDHNEKLIFEGETYENFLIDAYGLEDFRFPQLERNEILTTKRLFADKESVRPVFNSRRVKNVIIAIPILLAIVIIPVSNYKGFNNLKQNLQISSIVSKESITSPTVTKSEPAVKNEPAKAESVKSDEQILNATQVVSESNKEAATRGSRFKIIGGCFKVRENADNQLSKLRTNGYLSELKMQANGSYLIVVQTYNNKADALAAVKKLNEADPGIGYWMSEN